MEPSETYKAADAGECDDESLMASLQAGDEAALAALIRRYEQPLFNYALRMVGNAADAEEVFQETFVRVYLHRNRFWHGAPFKPWLYRIATNLAYDRLRYRQKRPEVQLSEDEHSADALSRFPSSSATPVARAENAERAEHMKRALAALKHHHRAVFLMAHQEGLSYAEIGQALNIPVGTVKSRMNTAVRKLMAALEALDS